MRKKGFFGADIEIYGCYFHLSQSFFRNIQLKGLINEFRTNKIFNKCFHLCQALAFLPISDVNAGFALLKDYVLINCKSFETFLNYVQINYIGEGTHKARFEIKTWNVHKRVLLGLPRTSNKLERFNKEFNTDSGDYHQATHDIIENLRLEQGNTEMLLLKIKMGEEKSKSILQENFDNALLKVFEQYDSDEIFSYLNSIAMTIQKHNQIINKSKGKKVGKLQDVAESEYDSDD